MLASKKQCGNNRKAKAKAKPSPSKDPQSIAAKVYCCSSLNGCIDPLSKRTLHSKTIFVQNRRERISERLKILQDLVPNGTKVASPTDTFSTMDKSFI